MTRKKEESEWYVAQCLQVDVASQGETEEAASENLQEALELHFELPKPSPSAVCEVADRGFVLAGVYDLFALEAGDEVADELLDAGK
ncbi:MAG: hypothetical protein M3Y58_03515 [Chloroflexota bacterium]|nr:hypothetical protein [Chloroflexota bacterium]